MDRIICGDAAETMAGLPDGCIDLTVTSPPYDNLRRYNGYTFDFEPIAAQLWRVTKPGGVVVWVVGDATIKGSETGTSFRQALGFMAIGFNLHDTMIWEKDGISFPDKSRYQQAFEYMLVLSKNLPIKINLLKDRKNKTSGTVFHGKDRDANGHLRKKSGYGTAVANYGIRWNVWREMHNERKTTHPAPFPEALARDHILSWSNPGDLVLDPMCGSGTTCKMAHLAGRHYLGIDISSEYCDLATQRLARVAAELRGELNHLPMFAEVVS